MTDPTFWNQFFIWPITNLLIFFYKIGEFLNFPGPLGFSIIVMTIFFRILLFPLVSAQMKSTKKIAKLKPHIDELQKKHKNDRQALQKAQMELYKQHGINPASGCLPFLIQMPIVIALYNVFYSVFATGDTSSIISQINQILYANQLHLSSLDLNFFGFNLAAKPSEWQTQGVILLSIPLITGLLQWYQIKITTTHQQIKQEPYQKEKEKEKQKEKDEKSQEDIAMEIQKQMAIITPIMFGFFAYQFPIGLSLYWNLFGVFGIIQQQHVNKKYD
ncbi:MAG: YidC/Oxa1 family membrane protein insertase [Patescibacteria group bacterium]|nr:YidC/Oxa1 family membrane protein insertase [Patescibacteria group bacterium]